jgi:hypothetical protein
MGLVVKLSKAVQFALIIKTLTPIQKEGSSLARLLGLMMHF